MFDEMGCEQQNQGCVEIIPSRKIRQRIYRCDKKFHTDVIESLLEDVCTNGIIMVFGDETRLYHVRGEEYHLQDRITSHIKNRHNNGGQSQNRFQRLREGQIHSYITTVVERICTYFPSTIQEIILAGSASKKMLVWERLPEDLRARTTLRTTSQHVTVDELITSFRHENKQLCQALKKFYEELRNDRVVYGESETRNYLEQGYLDVVFVMNGDVETLAGDMGTTYYNVRNDSSSMVSTFIREFGGWGGITRWKIED